MPYVCDLTRFEIRGLSLEGGSYEFAPDAYLLMSADGSWSVANEEGEIERIGMGRDSAIAYLIDVKASYEA
jgi:hypothetical protein